MLHRHDLWVDGSLRRKLSWWFDGACSLSKFMGLVCVVILMGLWCCLSTPYPFAEIFMETKLRYAAAGGFRSLSRSTASFALRCALTRYSSQGANGEQVILSMIYFPHEPFTSAVLAKRSLFMRTKLHSAY